MTRKEKRKSAMLLSALGDAEVPAYRSLTVTPSESPALSPAISPHNRERHLDEAFGGPMESHSMPDLYLHHFHTQEALSRPHLHPLPPAQSTLDEAFGGSITLASSPRIQEIVIVENIDDPVEQEDLVSTPSGEHNPFRLLEAARAMTPVEPSNPFFIALAVSQEEQQGSLPPSPMMVHAQVTFEDPEPELSLQLQGGYPSQEVLAEAFGDSHPAPEMPEWGEFQLSEAETAPQTAQPEREVPTPQPVTLTIFSPAEEPAALHTRVSLNRGASRRKKLLSQNGEARDDNELAEFPDQGEMLPEDFEFDEEGSGGFDADLEFEVVHAGVVTIVVSADQTGELSGDQSDQTHTWEASSEKSQDGGSPRGPLPPPPPQARPPKQKLDGPKPSKRKPKEQKEAEEDKEPKKERKESKETKESKESKETKESKESKETKESKESKETKESKESKETKEKKEGKKERKDKSTTPEPETPTETTEPAQPAQPQEAKPAKDKKKSQRLYLSSEDLAGVEGDTKAEKKPKKKRPQSMEVLKSAEKLGEGQTS